MIPRLSRFSLSRWFGALLRSGPIRRPAARRVQLAVEVLEGRAMPSMVTVTSATDDPNDTGSLRYALENATPGEIIDFAPDVRTIDLSNTLNSTGLTISVNLSIIDDQGVGPVTIDGGGVFTVFAISDNSVTATLSGLTIADGIDQTYAGGILNNGTLTVSNCTFSNNSANNDGYGGGIQTSGALTVNNCTFSDNSATNGAGIFVGGGSARVSNSSFDGNISAQVGGGIFNQGGTLTVSNSNFVNNSAINGGGIDISALSLVSNCTFSGNSASSGGGIYNSGGTLTVSDSTFSNNSAGGDSSNADSGEGGGIYSGGTLTVSNCTFSGNSASSGGGIYGSTLTVSNSTFSGNSAVNGEGEGGGIFDNSTLIISDCTFFNNSAQSGGAIFNQGNTLTASNSTISGNSVASGGSSGGGIALLSDPAFVTLDGDIVAGNVNTSSGTTPDDIAGLVGPSSSDNLFGTGGSGGLFNGQNGNQVGVSVADIGLGELGSNGGPTQTLAIGSGSFALGKGVTETTATTDQRGVARPVNAPSDVGAYQYSAALIAGNPASVVPFTGALQSATVADTFEPLEAYVTDAFGNPVSGARVTFAVVAGANGATGGFATNATVTTNSHGIAIAPVLTAGQIAGTFTVTASVNGVANPADFNLTNTPSVPATVTAVGGTPQNAPISSVFGTALQAKVVDAYGNPLANVLVTFAAPLVGPSGSFNALTTVPTNALGIATAPAFTANHVVGSFTITATVPGIVTPATFVLTNTAIPAAIQIYAGSGQHASVNSAFTTPLEARVTNAAGLPVVGITVNFELPGSAANGTFPGSAAVVTNANGVAIAPLTANTVAGSFTVAAWVGNVKMPATFTLANLPLGPSAVNVIAGSGQAAALGVAYAETLQTQVVDQYGNPLKGVAVTFRAPTTGASGTLAGHTTATAVTGANGIATVAITANHTAGNFQVTASVAHVSTPATIDLTNSPIHAIRIVAGSPQSATINTTYAAAFEVKVVDAAGNPLSGVSITFTAPSSGASGTFATSATVLTNAEGIATAPVFTANDVAGSFDVEAELTSPVAGVPLVTFVLRNVA